MSKPKLLFTAPLDFDYAVWKEYSECFDVREYLGVVDVLVCNPNASFVIDDSWLGTAPKLKVLATPSTGTNHIDLEACRKRGIKVLSLLDDREGLETISASAEFTFKLLLDALRMPPARELQGKSVGLVGVGRIGSKLWDYCEAFKAKVRGHDVQNYSYPLTKIFSESDAVIICCSLTPETRGMITYDLLSSMKQSAVLVNTARGEIIDEPALLRIMDECPDLRVAVDVVCGEVDGQAGFRRAALKARGAIVTNHIAGATFESRTKAAQIILNLLKKELALNGNYERHFVEKDGLFPKPSTGHIQTPRNPSFWTGCFGGGFWDGDWDDTATSVGSFYYRH
jgi:D-3-phosphoglycerate dehydrogenase / 2-oxoglutarate reductase